MRDAGPMRAIERGAGLHGDRQRFLHRQGAGSPDALGERLTLQELEDQIVEVAVSANVVDGADVRVVERGNGARFLLETAPRFRVAGERASQDFDGNGAIEPRITGAKDLAHSAFAKRSNDLVRTEPSAGVERHATARRGPGRAPLPRVRAD